MSKSDKRDDPLAKVLGEGLAQSDPLEALRESAVAAEMEVLAARYAAKAAQPPIAEPPAGITEAEYAAWIAPPAAIKRLESILAPVEATSEIYRRLCGGEVISVARSAIWYSRDGLDVRDFGRLGSFLWAANTEPHSLDLLWKTGTHTLSRPDFPNSRTRHNVECFGIRFDPDGIKAILTDAGIGTTRPEPVQGASGPDDRAQLARADAERFCRAILAGWLDATQDFAHDKAVLFFPDKRVPRDWFRSILRSIRGAAKPGKKPKPQD